MLDGWNFVPTETLKYFLDEYIIIKRFRIGRAVAAAAMETFLKMNLQL